VIVIKAVNLKTEHMSNPIGIDIVNPYLSWQCSSGKKQSRPGFTLPATVSTKHFTTAKGPGILCWRQEPQLS
jgi:hypothetical protein